MIVSEKLTPGSDRRRISFSPRESLSIAARIRAGLQPLTPYLHARKSKVILTDSTVFSSYTYEVNATFQHFGVQQSGVASGTVDGSADEVAYAARWTYDAFGRTTWQSDDKWSGVIPHRFSTKERCWRSGLYYYGYRYYDPVTGRWQSRDPIGEKGGANLYGMVGNDGLGKIDYLGLKAHVFSVEKAGPAIPDEDALVERSNADAKKFYDEISDLTDEEFEELTQNGIFITVPIESDGRFNDEAEAERVSLSKSELLEILEGEQDSRKLVVDPQWGLGVNSSIGHLHEFAQGNSSSDYDYLQINAHGNGDLEVLFGSDIDEDRLSYGEMDSLLAAVNEGYAGSHWIACFKPEVNGIRVCSFTRIRPFFGERNREKCAVEIVISVPGWDPE